MASSGLCRAMAWARRALQGVWWARHLKSTEKRSSGRLASSRAGCVSTSVATHKEKREKIRTNVRSCLYTLPQQCMLVLRALLQELWMSIDQTPEAWPEKLYLQTSQPGETAHSEIKPSTMKSTEVQTLGTI